MVDFQSFPIGAVNKEEILGNTTKLEEKGLTEQHVIPLNDESTNSNQDMKRPSDVRSDIIHVESSENIGKRRRKSKKRSNASCSSTEPISEMVGQQAKNITKTSETAKSLSYADTSPSGGFRTRGTSLTCTICSMPFTRLYNLKRHMSTHTGEKPYSCSECDARFVQHDGLRRHMLIHTGEKPFKCDICEAEFRQPGGLKDHMRKHFGEKPFSCTKCEQSFRLSSELRGHMKTHLDERTDARCAPKPFSCPLCVASFNLADHLNRHMVIHAGMKAFPCTECGKSFKEAFLLKLHMRRHGEEKPHLCPMCGETFRHDNALRYHVKKHGTTLNGSKEKPYQCAKCQSSFTRLGNFEHHMARHDANEVMYCTECGIVFSHQRKLRSHMLIQHGLPIDTDKEGEDSGLYLECPACSVIFTQPDSLKKHMDCHISNKDDKK